MRPWALRLEHEVNRKLLGGNFTAEHNFYDLQRGDFATQTAGFQTLRNIGVYHADAILKKLRENPIGPAKGGEVLTVQGAMINIETLINPGEAPDEPNLPAGDGADDDPADPAAKRRLLVAYKRLFQDATARFLSSKQPSEAFAARIFKPLATSIAEAMLAYRFGNSTITPAEEKLIAAVLPKGNDWWVNAPAQKLAIDLMNQIYDGLAKEILV